MLEDQYESDTLISAIVEGWKPSELAEYCDVPIREVKQFYKRHRYIIEERKEEHNAEQLRLAEEESHPDTITESEEGTEEERISSLWISSKYKRLKKYQRVADILLDDIEDGKLDATTLREARSFMMYVASELGQIPNRGSGTANMDGETASYEVVGVEMGALS
jgi:hypothetical protein